MPWELFRKAVDQTPGYVETITLSLIGEPLLHPQIHEMIDYIAERGKRAILFTNGTLLGGERLVRIARSRLSVLNVSVEVDDQTAREIRGADQQVIRRHVEEFVAAKRSETEVKLSVVAHRGNVDRLDRLRQDWGDLIGHIKVSPVMSFKGDTPPGQCMEPWRGNLNVFTNGKVSPCCIDWGASLIIGDLNEQNLDEIIQGPAYRELLSRFLAGKSPAFCRTCEEFTDPRVPLRMPRREVVRRASTS